MIRRIALICVALVALMGATDAVAKKKKPKVLTGPYVGRTSNGIELAITLNADRATGSIAYCGLNVPFTTAGSISAKSFAVNYTDPDTLNILGATGFFSAKQRSVSGTIAPESGGCDSTPQTYFIQR
jgi:hypothetical protein